MKISKFLLSFLFIGASVVGQGLIGNASEKKMTPAVPTADAPTGGSAPAPTAQKSDTPPSGGAPIESPSSPGTLPPAGSSPTDSPSTPPAGGAPVSPAEPPSGGPGTPSPSGPSPTDSPSTPPSSGSPSPEPQGGGNLSPSSTSASPTKSSSVLATCGRGGASSVYDSADEVPVGCHVSTINAPPASVLQQK